LYLILTAAMPRVALGEARRLATHLTTAGAAALGSEQRMRKRKVLKVAESTS